MAQINKPGEYFNTKLYTGNGGTNTITGVGFQPDWVWVKNRDIGTDAPTIYDAVRGATKRLQTSSTGAESTKTNGLTAFGSDGYTAGSASAINANGSNIVSWNWLGANGTAANTDGSISSTVSANTTSGFSIVSYTGTGSNATVGHGLGSAPKVIIAKTLNDIEDWGVYHQSIGAGNFLRLNTTDASSSATTVWNNTTPTNSVFSLGTSGLANQNNINMIAYCFAEKKGFSKFGSYIGNGNNANGPFVYTGFKPAFVIFKRTSGTGNWQLLDNKRLGYNPLNNTLYPNTTVSEQDEGDIYLYSNGFQLRGTGTDGNGSGSTYIYMAFAEQPLVGTNNIPATAR